MLDTTHQVALLIHCIQDARPNLKPPPHLVLWRGDHRRRLRVSRAQGSTTPECRQDHRSGRCRWCCRPCRWFGLGFHLPQAASLLDPAWVWGWRWGSLPQAHKLERCCSFHSRQLGTRSSSTTATTIFEVRPAGPHFSYSQLCHISPLLLSYLPYININPN